MEKKTENLNIFQRLAKIQSELWTVAKNLNVSTGAWSYKAVSERDVIDAVKPLEEKYWVYSYPYSREIIEQSILTKENSYNWQTKKINSFYLRVKTVYRFVNIDKPEEFIETVTFWDGIDTWDKATWKATTYSDKYALMKAYKISTGDDPDKDASPETWYWKEKTIDEMFKNDFSEEDFKRFKDAVNAWIFRFTDVKDAISKIEEKRFVNEKRKLEITWFIKSLKWNE